MIFIFETTKNLREGFLIDDQFSFALSKKSYHCAKRMKTDNRVLPRFFDKCVQYCEKYPLPRNLRFYKSPEKDRRRSFISLRRVPNRATDNVQSISFGFPVIQFECSSFANLTIIVRDVVREIVFSDYVWHLTLALLHNDKANSFQQRDFLYKSLYILYI